MIERKFVSERLKEFAIKEFIDKSLGRVGHSNTKLQKTPLGEKITVTASRPGLVVGKSGVNITKLTRELKSEFNLENPQIELGEIENIYLDARVVAESIAGALERFGSQRFKGIGHKVMGEVMRAGALGVEILISGKIPGARAKSWRFYQGYLKKCGDIAMTGVSKAQAKARLKVGIIGIKVSILPATTVLPDKFSIKEDITEIIEPIDEEKSKKESSKKKATPKKKTATKKKKTTKAESAKEEKPVESSVKEATPEDKDSKKKEEQSVKQEEAAADKPSEE